MCYVFVLRYGLPVIIVVFNNNGIAFGLPGDVWDSIEKNDDLLLRYAVPLMQNSDNLFLSEAKEIVNFPIVC